MVRTDTARRPADLFADTAAAPLAIGAVRFVNTQPLIAGLESLADVRFEHAVPSDLLDLLLGGSVEVALVSSIDYQASPEPLVILPCGQLGCDGPTMTVRLYGQRPLDELDVVHADTDSHTSVTLLQVLMRERFGRRPEVVPFNARERMAGAEPLEWPEAMLLIGDKVVTDSPPAVRYPHQLDLGEAWKELTGLPFVFAAWMARASTDRDRVRLASAVLDRQRRANVRRLERIVTDAAVPRGWPMDLAVEYLHHRLRFELDDRSLEGLAAFHRRASELGLVERCRPIEVVD